MKDYIHTIDSLNTLNINLKHNLSHSKNIKPYNLIISDKDGFEEILDTVSTMNVIKRVVDQKEGIYNKIKANTLETFVSRLSVEVIDFLKIDIEGSEQNLLSDLQKVFLKSVQIE